MVAAAGLINRCEPLSTSEVGLNIVHCGWQRTTFSTGWWLQPVLKGGWSLVPVGAINPY